jgi:hypothetical protein
MVKLTIGNTVRDLSRGDIYEYLPVQSVPLGGDVLGIGTTTLPDNGELVFLADPSGTATRIYHCHAEGGGVTPLDPASHLLNFPFACFTSDASPDRVEIGPDLFAPAGTDLRTIIEQGILQSGQPCEIYGIRMQVQWERLHISVASQLGLWQANRYETSRRRNLYAELHRYCFAEHDPGEEGSRYLGRSLRWDLCGFYSRCPEKGLLTMPHPGDNLHMHGCSSDLAFGGHILHDRSVLSEVLRFLLVPVHEVEILKSRLRIQEAALDGNTLRFAVANQGRLDVENVDVHVVFDNEYRSRLYRRIPLLAAGDRCGVTFPLGEVLRQGKRKQIEIFLDPDHEILEPDRSGHRVLLTI